MTSPTPTYTPGAPVISPPHRPISVPPQASGAVELPPVLYVFLGLIVLLLFATAVSTAYLAYTLFALIEGLRSWAESVPAGGY